MISKEKKTAIMKEYARTEGDTGSPEVQVAVLTDVAFLLILRKQTSKDTVH